MVVADEVILTLAVTVGVTTIVIALEVAGLPVTQLAFEVITQVTTSLFARLMDVKVLLFVPEFVPLTFHW
jgi:hypothetical protein